MYKTAIVDELGYVMFWCDELQRDEQIECILNGHPEWSVKCIVIQKVRWKKMDVLRVELVKETEKLKKYKITYQEDDIFTTKVVGRTFNYGDEEIKNIPETVLDFAEAWILGEL